MHLIEMLVLFMRELALGICIKEGMDAIYYMHCLGRVNSGIETKIHIKP